MFFFSKIGYTFGMLSQTELNLQGTVGEEYITLPVSEYNSLKALISKQREQIKLLQAALFGKKSEKKAPLIGDDQTTEKEAVETETVVSYERKKRKKNKRLIDTSKLPRYKLYHDLAERNCPNCCEALHCFGEALSEQLEILPEVLYVIEHIRKKYACRKCDTVFMGEKPSSPIPKGLAGASLIKEVILNKYEYHVPLYRQSKIFSRKGIQIPDNVMSRWVMQVGKGLMPLYDSLWEAMTASHYLQSDESPVKVLKPEKKGYFWCYLSPTSNLVFYELSLTRKGVVAEKRLKNYKGLLQTDGYSGYHAIKQREDITGFNCMTHARRKFNDVVKISKNKDGLAALALSKLSLLYEIESYARENKLTFRQRKKLRQKKAIPILKAFKKWLHEIRPKVPPKSKLAEAINYMLKRWRELLRYTRHGKMEIDTNLVENKMRSVALGRKNWLAVGHEASGKISALFYSLVGSCIMNGINPRVYMHYILTKIHDLRQQKIDPVDLLPNRIKREVLEQFEKEQILLAQKVLSQQALNTEKEITVPDPPG